MNKSQLFFWFLLSFIVGVFFASIFNFNFSFLYTGLIIAVGLIGVFGYYKIFNFYIFLTGVLGLAFFLGAIRFNTVDYNYNSFSTFIDREVRQEGLKVLLRGYVNSEKLINGNRVDFVFRAKDIVVEKRIIKVNNNILVTTDSSSRINYGDLITVRGAIQKPKNTTDFDFINYLKKENITATIFYPEIKEFPALQLSFIEKIKINIYRNILNLKQKFQLAIEKSISEPNASFINGILLGSRQNIPNDLKEAFHKTGTVHVLAISGYNIMIIAGSVLAGLVLFLKRKWAFWISVLAILIFVILTGATASVVRAAIMGFLLLFAQGYGRLYDPKNSIIFAGATMIFFNPFIFRFDIGFQLSFAAVLGLMYLYPYLDSKLEKVPKLGTLKEIVLMTISAQIAVMPLLLYYFKNFSVISLPSNILVLPFIPFAMFMGFISGVSGLIFLPLGKLFGWFAWAITTYQLEVIRLFAKII